MIATLLLTAQATTYYECEQPGFIAIAPDDDNADVPLDTRLVGVLEWDCPEASTFALELTGPDSELVQSWSFELGDVSGQALIAELDALLEPNRQYTYRWIIDGEPASGASFLTGDDGEAEQASPQVELHDWTQHVYEGWVKGSARLDIEGRLPSEHAGLIQLVDAEAPDVPLDTDILASTSWPLSNATWVQDDESPSERCFRTLTYSTSGELLHESDDLCLAEGTRNTDGEALDDEGFGCASAAPLGLAWLVAPLLLGVRRR